MLQYSKIYSSSEPLLIYEGDIGGHVLSLFSQEFQVEVGKPIREKSAF